MHSQQYSTVQYSTVQYSTVQYSTVQYSTVQYSTVQYSQLNEVLVAFLGSCLGLIIQITSISGHIKNVLTYSEVTEVSHGILKSPEFTICSQLI
jgi:hypothetical protein